MYNFKEGGGTPPYFDFVGPVVDRSMSFPYDGLVVPRIEDDYSKGRDYLLPPNTLRTLISREALENLNAGFMTIQQKFPNRFRNFDIHMRGLYQEEELVLPWDILTYVNFDGMDIYAPVNVSFSHIIMSTLWDLDPDEDFRIKREIIENQISAVSSRSIPGINTAVYGVSFPERFSHGITDRIFRGYPSFFENAPKCFDEFRALKRNYDLGQPTGEYAFYFFRGNAISRDKFLEVVDDPAFVFYNQEVTRRWNDNFSNLIRSSSLTEGEIANKTIHRILRCFGASPEPLATVEENKIICE